VTDRALQQPPPLVFDRRRIVHAFVAGLALAATRPTRAEESDDLMTPVRERYAALHSYSDTGRVETTYQWPATPVSIDHYNFVTAFRAPRNFFFRFEADPAADGDVFVIWCDGGPFQSWWKSTGVHEVYDGGRGTFAFGVGALPTKDAANLIAPFLFPQAGMKGVISNLIEAKEQSQEAIDGRICRKLIASERETGMGPEELPITVWIDNDSGLVRRATTEAQAGSAAGLIDRIDYTLDPLADADIPDDRFSFAPPA
jgi:hypothetical protein